MGPLSPIHTAPHPPATYPAPTPTPPTLPPIPPSGPPGPAVYEGGPHAAAAESPTHEALGKLRNLSAVCLFALLLAGAWFSFGPWGGGSPNRAGWLAVGLRLLSSANFFIPRQSSVEQSVTLTRVTHQIF